MNPHPLTIRRTCLFVFCLALALMLGQGFVRFHGVLGATGQRFIELNRADALDHATIAQSILSGGGYAFPQGYPGGSPREAEPAFAKAPGYPYFLAAVFRIAGFGFWFFPLQSLIGACLSVLVVFISLETFKSHSAALFAGVAAAVHPVLVNTASQLYNENLYFCLLFLSLWIYLRWHRTLSPAPALLCGCCAGVTALMREAALGPFAVLVIWAAISAWRRNRLAAVRFAAAMAAGMIAVVLPWTIRNYVATGEFVPVSVASLHVLAIGNNSCVAADGWTTPFFGDDPCPQASAETAKVIAGWQKGTQVTTRMRASAEVAERYILAHPGAYMKLCFRRAWTVFDPWHPRQHLSGAKRWAMMLYFLVFVASGIAGAVRLARRGASFQVKTLYIFLLVSYAPLVAIYVSMDHRHAIGIHLILACFAGAWIDRLRGRVAPGSGSPLPHGYS